MFASSRKWLAMALLTALAACSTTAPPPVAVPTAPTFAVSHWEMLPDWQSINLALSWPAFMESCDKLKNRPHWQDICVAAAQVATGDSAAQRAFYEQWFVPYQVYNPDGSDQGLITGYYEPMLHGSRFRSKRYRYPLYGEPDDLLTIDLGDVYPQLKGMRLRGRLEGKRVVPYYDRAAIDANPKSLKRHVLFWVDDPVDLFFLQVQGSGRIVLPNGTQVRVGYANQNGYPYVSIGRKLVEMGELTLDQASMQSIKAWAEKNPDKLPALLEQNPSYVFFRILPDGLDGPIGALGVPLTGAYSLAVDRSVVPLGAPVFLATTEPDSNIPLNRLMLAQDTGGAIKGSVRADFFWGSGDQAGEEAGRMKQMGKMWVLFPKGAEPALN